MKSNSLKWFGLGFFWILGPIRSSETLLKKTSICNEPFETKTPSKRYRFEKNFYFARIWLSNRLFPSNISIVIRYKFCILFNSPNWVFLLNLFMSRFVHAFKIHFFCKNYFINAAILVFKTDNLLHLIIPESNLQLEMKSDYM